MSEEGTKLPEPRCCVRNDTHDDSHKNEEPAFGMNLQQARQRTGTDWTFGKGVACDTSQEDRKLSELDF